MINNSLLNGKIWGLTSIFKGILPMGLLAMLICVPMVLWNTTDIFGFLAKGVLFMVVYCGLVWKWGLLKEERDFIKNTFHFIKRK